MNQNRIYSILNAKIFISAETDKASMKSKNPLHKSVALPEEAYRVP